jgi:hypothetical protein
MEFYTKRNEVLFGTAEKFCTEQGLPKDFIYKVYKSESDWEFILKVDALLETAAKLILRNGLQIQLRLRTFEDKSSFVEVPTGVIQNEILEEFVDGLPMDGRTSLLRLLEASGLPNEDLGFIRAARQVRNGFAHDIKSVNSKLIDIIKPRPDKSNLVKLLCAIQEYDEAELIAQYEDDPSFFRFGIFDWTLRFLLYAYHIGKS